MRRPERNRTAIQETADLLSAQVLNPTHELEWPGSADDHEEIKAWQQSVQAWRESAATIVASVEALGEELKRIESGGVTR